LYFEKKIMRKTFTSRLGFMLLVSFMPFTSFCQTAVPGDSLKSMMVQDWLRAKAYTQEYMMAMPANKYSFRASDSVRTFAQQLLHLAQANMFLVSTAMGEKLPARPDPEKSATAQTADSVAYYVNSSYDYAISSIQKISPWVLWQTASVNFGKPIVATRYSWLLKAFEHQTHHRGQTTIYIRLAGIRPPNERLF
jgi:uncharacterized damage-inducible protein DinB